MAWKFRQEFQSRLGLVFDHLSTIYHSFPGRITAETFKKQIIAVVDIWEDWIVFPPDFTSELRARLEGSTTKENEAQDEQIVSEVKETTLNFSSKFKASSFIPADETANPIPTTGIVESNVDGEPMNEGSDIDGEPVDDMDGEPMNADLDGEPMDDIDGVPMDNSALDGEPIDGEPIDGEPMMISTVHQ